MIIIRKVNDNTNFKSRKLIRLFEVHFKVDYQNRQTVVCEAYTACEPRGLVYIHLEDHPVIESHK